MRNVTISRLVKDLEDNYSLCFGVDEHVLEITGKLFHHVVRTAKSQTKKNSSHTRATGEQRVVQLCMEQKNLFMVLVKIMCHVLQV